MLHVAPSNAVAAAYFSILIFDMPHVSYIALLLRLSIRLPSMRKQGMGDAATVVVVVVVVVVGVQGRSVGGTSFL